MLNTAKEKNISSAVFTFAQSPSVALGKSESRILMKYDDKISAFDRMKIDKCFAPNFLDLRDISAEDFAENILIKTLNAKAIFCGYNYRFGKFASGGCGLLSEICEKNGVDFFVVSPVCYDGTAVSSSRIRNLIEQGKLYSANALLKYPFSISGEIIHGKQNGRTVGIPTINQSIPDYFVTPRFGAYASFAILNGVRYNAVTNIGIRPTVLGEGVNCETHILDNFSGELYGKKIRTQLLWFERDERKFQNLNELAQQISRDISHIEELKIYEKYRNGEYKKCL